MTNGNPVNQLVSQLVGSGLDAAKLQATLATSFKQTDENPYWTFYEFELKNSPFTGGEFRLSKAGGQALLSLTARESPGLLEDDLELSTWGEVIGIEPNPRIPPEGADAYIFTVEGVKVSFQLTHTSRQLRVVALEWGAAA